LGKNLSASAPDRSFSALPVFCADAGIAHLERIHKFKKAQSFFVCGPLSNDAKIPEIYARQHRAGYASAACSLEHIHSDLAQAAFCP
jgi:uncharacterized protein YciI